MFSNEWCFFRGEGEGSQAPKNMAEFFKSIKLNLIRCNSRKTQARRRSTIASYISWEAGAYLFSRLSEATCMSELALQDERQKKLREA